MEDKRVYDAESAQFIHDIVVEVTEQATINALKNIRKEDEGKNKYDKRLRNTELLLKNYRNFKEHVENAMYLDDELIDKKVENDLEDNEKIYLKSVLRTKKRTELMIKNIDRLIEYYTYKCLASKKEDVQRRIQVIKMLYINDKRMSYSEIAKELRQY